MEVFIMTRPKCPEDKIIWFIVERVERDKPVKSVDELAKEVMNLCEISEAHAYRLIRTLMDKGSIAFIPGYGFVAVNKRHLDLILATYELILDAVRTGGVLDEPPSSYYGVKLSKETLLTLMSLALMHAITSMVGWRDEIGRVAKIIRELRGIEEKLAHIKREADELVRMREGIAFKVEFIEEFRKVLDIKPPYDPVAIANIVLDELLPSIANSVDVKGACYSLVLSGEARWSEYFYKTLCDKIDVLEREAPILHARFKKEVEMAPLRSEASRLKKEVEEWYNRLMEWIKKLALELRTYGGLQGRCWLCVRGFRDEELELVIEDFIRRRKLTEIKVAEVKEVIPRLSSY
jgi:hypothetical protein